VTNFNLEFPFQGIEAELDLTSGNYCSFPAGTRRYYTSFN